MNYTQDGCGGGNGRACINQLQFTAIKKMADVDFTTMLCEPELVIITARTVLFAYINLGINNIYLTNFMVLMLCLFGYLFKICFLLAKDYGKIDKPPSFLLSSILTAIMSNSASHFGGRNGLLGGGGKSFPWGAIGTGQEKRNLPPQLERAT